MVVSVHAKMQSEANADKSKQILHTEAFIGDKHDLKMQLTEVLQTSLDLNVLLSIFLERVSTVVRLDGIHYINDEANVTAAIAKQASHSCGYRLITNEDNLGEIVFKRGKKFTEKELSILETLLSPLIHPLRNALRFSAATKAAFADPVTGIGNKVHMMGDLEREIDLAKRHNQALSVLMIEVDSLGKTASKALIKQSKLAMTDLAQRIVKLSRTTDGVYRCESGTFMAILSNTDRAGAHIMAKRISESAHDLVLVEDNQDVQKLTLSVGMAVLTGTDSSASLIDRAGKALNNAKKRGGNLIHS
tara:strand:- start:228 stop:1139 length:912 start_codon:yes stop_codon:yes gene_type:complete